MVKSENVEHVRKIADDLEAIAEGRAYIDSDSLDMVIVEDAADVPDDAELAGMWEYFDDMLDIDFILDSEFEFKAARICVAWGGPSVYVDTYAHEVALYWWNEYARADLAGYVCDAVDEFAAELFAMKAGR